MKSKLTCALAVCALTSSSALVSCANKDASNGAEVVDDDAGPAPTGASDDDTATDDDATTDDDVTADDDVASDDDVTADDDVAADDDVTADDDITADDDVIGDDDMDGGTADDDTTTEPDASVGGLGKCRVPDGATVIADYQMFNPDGGPVYGLVADGTTVYAAFVDRIVAIPQAGGMPTEVYQSDYGVALYDYGADDAFLVRSGVDWFDLQGMDVAPAAFPAVDLPGLSIAFAPKNADTIWVRGDDLYYRVATYNVLGRGEDAPRDVVAEVLQGTGGPLLTTAGVDSALVQNAPLDSTEPDFEAFTWVSEAGEFTVAALAEAGEPFFLTDNYVYYNRSTSAPDDEQGLWRAAVTADGFDSPVSLGSAPGIAGAVDGDQVAVQAESALYAIGDSDADAGASLAELATLDVRSDPGDACASHGLAAAGGEVITSLYHQKSNETVIFKVPLP
jgi:hypothetical protein